MSRVMTRFTSRVASLPRDQILVERRDIDQCAGIADGVVLVLVMHFVHADRVVSRPLAVVEAVAEGKGSFVKRSSDGQGMTSVDCRLPPCNSVSSVVKA